jgi:hypothetical protein
VRVEYNVRNDSVGCERHIRGRHYLGHDRLTALTSREFIALLEIANYLDLYAYSSMILLVLELHYAFNEARLIVRV